MDDQSSTDQELTLEQASDLTGRSIESLRQLARRGRIRKGRQTNSGKSTVILSREDIDRLSKAKLQQGGQPTGQPPTAQNVQPEQNPYEHLVIKALTGQVDVLTNHLNTLKSELEKAETAVALATSDATLSKELAAQQAAELASLKERLRLMEQAAQRRWWQRLFR